MIVRQALPVDSEAVLALIRSVPGLPQWTRAALAISDPEVRPTCGPARHLLIAEDRGEVLGFAQVATLLGEAELESMAVEPRYRRQGVGRLLLERAIDIARSDGAQVLRLEVRRGNTPGLRLYEKSGMTVTGTRPGYYSNPAEDALQLQLSWAKGG